MSKRERRSAPRAESPSPSPEIEAAVEAAAEGITEIDAPASAENTALAETQLDEPSAEPDEPDAPPPAPEEGPSDDDMSEDERAVRDALRAQVARASDLIETAEHMIGFDLSRLDPAEVPHAIRDVQRTRDELRTMGEEAAAVRLEGLLERLEQHGRAPAATATTLAEQDPEQWYEVTEHGRYAVNGIVHKLAKGSRVCRRTHDLDELLRQNVKLAIAGAPPPILDRYGEPLKIIRPKTGQNRRLEAPADQQLNGGSTEEQHRILEIGEGKREFERVEQQPPQLPRGR